MVHHAARRVAGRRRRPLVRLGHAAHADPDCEFSVGDPQVDGKNVQIGLQDVTRNQEARAAEASPPRIKTFHFTNAWEEKSGGIATFYRALMQAANEQEREMRLIVPGAEDRIEMVGRHVRIYHLQAPSAPLNGSYRIIYPHRFLFGGSKIQRILAQEQPDLIEICDKYNFNYLGALVRLRLLRDVSCRPIVLGLSCERMDDNF